MFTTVRASTCENSGASSLRKLYLPERIIEMCRNGAHLIAEGREMSLILGLYAAGAWAFHDLFVRQMTQKLAIVPMLFTVLLLGTVLLAPVAALGTGWAAMTLPAYGIAVGAGAAFAVASLCLYLAFSIGPVKLVAPIIGAYPVLSVGWAAVNGTAISGLQWGAVLGIVGGVALVATLSDASGGSDRKIRAIVFSILTGACFAATFATSQAAVRLGADLPVIFVARVTATVLIGVMLIVGRRPWTMSARIWGTLAVLGFLDASALALVTTAGSLPNPEFAAVASSLFGMLTVILARIFLNEPMTRPQWIAVVVVFGGIGLLGS